MCSGDDNVLAFLSNFIDNLLGTSSQKWIQQIKHPDIDIFSHSMLIMPFQPNGDRSLFVVLGAKHIKDYIKKGIFATYGPASFTFFPMLHPCKFKHMHIIRGVSNYKLGLMQCGKPHFVITMFNPCHSLTDLCQ